MLREREREKLTCSMLIRTGNVEKNALSSIVEASLRLRESFSFTVTTAKYGISWKSGERIERRI